MFSLVDLGSELVTPPRIGGLEGVDIEPAFGVPPPCRDPELFPLLLEFFLFILVFYLILSLAVVITWGRSRMLFMGHLINTQMYVVLYTTLVQQPN